MARARITEVMMDDTSINAVSYTHLNYEPCGEGAHRLGCSGVAVSKKLAISVD